ncbi:hypothetical protein Pcinc_009115 [Petrolisthes cinctipes]|uniref:Uncharacterized protein n=1 Tax=Petrolisthes cinctipes TaxID=88211 RepID=A0AAE1G7G3_PETCI|nr:hypothetical protein Pcinc_009115 [Petrolisthes cinctipes]
MWWAALGTLLVVVGVLAVGALVVWQRVGACGGEMCGRGRVIVVTGCDSGIGFTLALHAQSRWGVTVIGTVMHPEGKGALLLKEAGVVVVQVDLTRRHTFDNLTTAINNIHQNTGQEVWCLVNNAGVMTLGQCEWQTEGQTEAQVGVNLGGTIHITRTLLPTLRRNKGRVVMVSSPVAQVSTPNLTVYSATKAGLEGFSHALRRELTPFGTSVVIVRPCNLPGRTSILRQSGEQLEDMLKEAREETLKDFSKDITQMREHLQEAFGEVEGVKDLKDHTLLLQCFRSAILSERPLATYSAAPWPVTFALDLLQCLPTTWVDFLVAHNAYNWILSFAANK